MSANSPKTPGNLNPVPFIQPPTQEDTSSHYTRFTPRSGSTRSVSSSEASSSARPPDHLSEFFSFMSNKPNIPTSPTHTSGSRDFPPVADFKDRKNFNRQPSLNTFTSFSPSVLDLPNIVTSKDFQSNIDTYANLMDKAANLRKTLSIVSDAANEFGQALEDCINDCPKVNNSRAVCDGIISAAGLQYMIGSNQQILSRLISTSFEEPLKEELSKLKEDYNYSYGFYQQEVKQKSKILREKELENIKLSKQRTRNLNTYKNNLLNLTNQLDEIDRLKYDYYHEINSMIERFNNEHLLIKTGSLVKAQLEIFEGIAKKGWSGGGLDELLSISPDLFEASYDTEENADPEQVFGENSLDKSSSIATFKQHIADKKLQHPIQPLQDIGASGSNTGAGSPASSILEVEDPDLSYDGDDTILHNSRLSPVDKETQSRRSKGSPLGTSILSKFSPTLGNVMRSAEHVSMSPDESFSLPVVNNSNSLLSSKSKVFDEPSPNGHVDSLNILDDLDD